MADKVHSVSSITQYNKCPTLYNLNYNFGYRGEDKYKDAKDRGTCVHAGLEAWLRAHEAPDEQRREAAINAARYCSKEDFIDDDVRSEAATIIEYYLDKLPSMKPVILNGEPLTEFHFQSAFPKYGVSLKGMVDAVVTLEDDSVVLIDWKVRGSSRNFYRDLPLQIDRQIPVYAAVMKHVYGVNIDRAYQVQMSATLPAVPRVLKGKDGTNADDYDSRLGKTTSEILNEAAQAVDEDKRDDFFLQYFEKVTGDDEFIVWSNVDLSSMDRMLHLTLQSAAKINQDTDFLPILDAYACKFCPVLLECKNHHFPNF